MRKFLVSVLAVAVLGVGSAFAQSSYWGGLSTGWPLGGTLHFGMDDLLGPGLDLRFNLRGNAFSGSATGVTYSGFEFSVGADVLYDIADAIDDPAANVYVGGGLTAGFASGQAQTTTTPRATGSIGGLAYDLHGLAGVEYLFTQNWGVFGEGQVGYGGAVAAVVDSNGKIVSASDSGLTFGFRLGVNYHF